jgi:hypothetical protein
MSFTFVTAYFEFNKDKNTMYFNQFKKLVETNFPIILYLDRKLEERKEELSKYSNLQIILIDWDDLFINKFIKDENIEKIQIPMSNSKDNLNFLILMNSKNYFIKEASKISDKPIITWIDFGIMKITNDIAHFKYNFSNLHSLHKVLIPGGFREKTLLNDLILMHSIFWRFLGGLIICPRNLVDTFNDECDKETCSLLKTNKLTWEVNLWANVEYKNQDLIRYFKADHNRAMFGLFDKKRLSFCVIENNGSPIDSKIKSFIDSFEGKCEGFVINIINTKHNLQISDSIYQYVNYLKSRNCNVKLYVDTVKNDKKTNELIINANVIDYCRELGWDINHTFGIFEKDKRFIPLNTDFYEEFIRDSQ